LVLSSFESVHDVFRRDLCSSTSGLGAACLAGVREFLGAAAAGA